MIFDLNVLWPNPVTAGSISNLNKTLHVLNDLGYSCVALNYPLVAKSGPSPFSKCPIDLSLASLSKPPGMQLLTRITLIVDDISQNQNMVALSGLFDIVAVRPLSEKALQSCCSSLDIDLISLDMSNRLQFFLKHKTVLSAIQRGVKFEIFYSPGTAIQSSSSLNDPALTARRNLIANASALIRSTRGRGLVISSQSSSPLSCRGPYDIINLACTWGLDHMNARNAVTSTAEAVVKNSKLRNSSYKQVIQVVDSLNQSAKRSLEGTESKLSKKRK